MSTFIDEVVSTLVLEPLSDHGLRIEIQQSGLPLPAQTELNSTEAKEFKDGLKSGKFQLVRARGARTGDIEILSILSFSDSSGITYYLSLNYTILNSLTPLVLGNFILGHSLEDLEKYADDIKLP